MLHGVHLLELKKQVLKYIVCLSHGTDPEVSTCKFLNTKSNKKHEASTWQVKIAFSYHKPNSEKQVACR